MIGGGLLGLEAARGLQAYGLQVDVVHAGPHLMNAQIGPAGGEILRKSVEELGIEVHTKARTTAIMGEDKVRGVWLLDHPLLECDMVVVAAGIRPNVDLAVTSGFTVERAIVVDDQMRTDGRPRRLRGRRVRAAPRRGLRPGRAAVGAGRGAGRPGHRRRPGRRLPRLPDRDQAQGGRRRRRLDGRAGPGAGHRRAHRLLRAAARASTSRWSSGTRSSSAQRCSATAPRSRSCMQAFDRGLPLPEERLEMLFNLGTPAEEVGVAELADDAQVCNCNGVTKGALVACVESGVKIGRRR